MNTVIGNTELHVDDRSVLGGYVDVDGERFYRIARYDAMRPFLMSLVSDSDHWMFVSSTGGLTAGRKNPDHALFPYFTDDRIHDAQDRTGGKTLIRILAEKRESLWEPLSDRYGGMYAVRRNLYKNVPGNKVIFEEINEDLGLTFRTGWMHSERFGFVKRSTLINGKSQSVHIRILDGIQNILPYGVTRRFQLEYSTLADGYKKSELDPETGLGLFTMSSIPTDKAEPSEALRATTVWSAGLPDPVHLLCTDQLDVFRRGAPLIQETDVRGRRGAYFIDAQFVLDPNEQRSWFFAADVAQDHADAADCIRMLKTESDPAEHVLNDVEQGTENLIRIAAGADGLQASGDALSVNRHFANVLFNVMRGGIFDRDYRIDRADFLSFIETANRPLMKQHRRFLHALPETMDHAELIRTVRSLGDNRLERLTLDYLPLTFGRRHGDPSRPWNIFSIDIKDSHGGKVLNYQGNWRDIFQNWEALAHSFPGYVESMIGKFLNATTADGYNPYRVMRDGFEWEVLDPDDPWSYIGYWGDHQIVYLLRLMETSSRFHPGALHDFLIRDVFAYANVPYRIRPYPDLLADPRNTIDFDAPLDEAVRKRTDTVGQDGKLLHDTQGRMILVNLTEKLLVTVLAKCANFIPEAGIWMNTQRPEWNDANNSLVGPGVSVVTLCHLRRFLAFMKALFESSPESEIPVAEEVARWFDRTASVLAGFAPQLNSPLSDQERKSMLDALGLAGSDYRETLYAKGFSGNRRSVQVASITAFCDSALRCIDPSIRANRREDGLFHAYNLMSVDEDGIRIRRLYEMLEGQVAVLGADLLSVSESLDVLDALRKSALHRDDQNSYLLYPDRRLPRFLEKNTLAGEAAASSELLSRMLEERDPRIAIRDTDGKIHFNSAFRNARILEDRLDQMASAKWGALIQKEKAGVLALYESLFDHQSFTGRSGTFYKYEGLGCIYWHMVSKLLVSVQEVWIRAVDEGAETSLIQRLQDHYTEIREGIGAHKPPDLYGAFPTDPYSHTPGFAGVQQPGMTGQVKEDILTRFGELGVRVRGGRIAFCKSLINRGEFLTAPGSYTWVDVRGRKRDIPLQPGMLAFTFCQTPVVCRMSEKERIRLTKADGSQQTVEGLRLSAEISQAIFNRTGEVVRLDVFMGLGDPTRLG